MNLVYNYDELAWWSLSIQIPSSLDNTECVSNSFRFRISTSGSQSFRKICGKLKSHTKISKIRFDIRIKLRINHKNERKICTPWWPGGWWRSASWGRRPPSAAASSVWRPGPSAPSTPIWSGASLEEWRSESDAYCDGEKCNIHIMLVDKDLIDYKTLLSHDESKDIMMDVLCEIWYRHQLLIHFSVLGECPTKTVSSN